jgi:hypothetical protein
MSEQSVGFGVWTIGMQNNHLSKLPPSLRSDGGTGKNYRLKSEVSAAYSPCAITP